LVTNTRQVDALRKEGKLSCWKEPPEVSASWFFGAKREKDVRGMKKESASSKFQWTKT
jgi:hypothetical protein